MNNLNKRSSSRKDLVYVLLFTIVSGFILISIDAFELIMEYSREHEEFEIDEILLIVFTLCVALMWYSIRRVREIQHFQKELLNTNTNLQLKVDNAVESIRKKDILVNEKMKMASLGEMLGNIAHQWRQPLSMISTSASGLKMKHRLSTLDVDDIENSLNEIVTTTKNLSQTIDDFSNFIKGDKEKMTFSILDNINTNLDILRGDLKVNNIQVIVDISEKFFIENYPNELTQVIINLIKNSKDAFIENSIKERYILISIFKKNDMIILDIKDNANGIKPTIIQNIFEPYFTTKHKSQGTGLGLFMVYKIINESMQGSIEVRNISFEHNAHNYYGANFIITLPQSF